MQKLVIVKLSVCSHRIASQFITIKKCIQHLQHNIIIGAADDSRVCLCINHGPYACVKRNERIVIFSARPSISFRNVSIVTDLVVYNRI